MKKWYNVINEKGAEKATVLIYDIIGGSFFEAGTNAKDFANTLMQLEKEYKSIDIRINSPGGSVFEGLGIVNAILNSKSEIHTYIDGIAYSMAAIIALSGKKVHIAKNGRLMLHNASVRVAGNADNLREEAKNLDGYDNSLAITISAITSLSMEEVKKKYFNYKDNYFNAQEALANNLVHEVLEVNAEGIDNIIKIDEYNAVLAHYKTLDPAAFKMPENNYNNNNNNMKYIALSAVLATLNEGKTPTAEELTAVQNELSENKTGLVINEEEEITKLTASHKTLNLINALFANAQEVTFNLENEIKALQTKAADYDALDGAVKTKHNAPPSREDAAKVLKETLDKMPHNQNADQLLA